MRNHTRSAPPETTETMETTQRTGTTESAAVEEEIGRVHNGTFILNFEKIETLCGQIDMDGLQEAVL